MKEIGADLETHAALIHHSVLNKGEHKGRGSVGSIPANFPAGY